MQVEQKSIKKSSTIDEVSTRVKLGSIKEALRQPAIQKKEAVVSSSQEKNASQELTVAAAMDFFKYLSDVLIEEKRASLAACLKEPLCSVDQNKITLTVPSKGIQQNIEEIESRIKVELNKKGFGNVELAYLVNAAKVSEYKLFTPQQQFDAMVKKNPLLKDFKDRFQLTFDE